MAGILRQIKHEYIVVKGAAKTLHQCRNVVKIHGTWNIIFEQGYLVRLYIVFHHQFPAKENFINHMNHINLFVVHIKQGFIYQIVVESLWFFFLLLLYYLH